MADIYEGTVKKQSLLSDIPTYKPEEKDTGFIENVKASFDEVSINRTSFAGIRPKDIEEDAFQKQYDIAKQNQLDISNAEDSKVAVAAFADKAIAIRDWQNKTDRIKELQQQYPDLGLKTYDEVRKEIDDVHANTEREYQKTTKNQTVAGVAGSIVGSIGGFFTDPINIAAAALPLGLGLGLKGATALGGVSRIALAEGAVNVGLAALSEPNTIKNKELVGLETSNTDIAKDLAVAGAFGAVGGAVAGGLSRVFNPVTKQAVEAADNLTAMAALGAKVPEESLIGAKAIQTTNELIGDVPDGVNQIRHSELTAKAIHDTFMGRPVQVDTPIKTPDSSINQAVVPALDPIPEASIKTARQQTIEDMTARADKEDLFVPIEDIDELGLKTTGIRNLRDILVETRKDTKAFELLHKCLLTGEVPHVVE